MKVYLFVFCIVAFCGNLEAARPLAEDSCVVSFTGVNEPNFSFPEYIGQHFEVPGRFHNPTNKQESLVKTFLTDKTLRAELFLQSEGFRPLREILSPEYFSSRILGLGANKSWNRNLRTQFAELSSEVASNSSFFREAVNTYAPVFEFYRQLEMIGAIATEIRKSDKEQSHIKRHAHIFSLGLPDMEASIYTEKNFSFWRFVDSGLYYKEAKTMQLVYSHMRKTISEKLLEIAEKNANVARQKQLSPSDTAPQLPPVPFEHLPPNDFMADFNNPNPTLPTTEFEALLLDLLQDRNLRAELVTQSRDTKTLDETLSPSNFSGQFVNPITSKIASKAERKKFEDLTIEVRNNTHFFQMAVRKYVPLFEYLRRMDQIEKDMASMTVEVESPGLLTTRTKKIKPWSIAFENQRRLVFNNPGSRVPSILKSMTQANVPVHLFEALRSQYELASQKVIGLGSRTTISASIARFENLNTTFSPPSVLDPSNFNTAKLLSHGDELMKNTLDFNTHYAELETEIGRELNSEASPPSPEKLYHWMDRLEEFQKGYQNLVEALNSTLNNLKPVKASLGEVGSQGPSTAHTRALEIIATKEKIIGTNLSTALKGLEKIQAYLNLFTQQKLAKDLEAHAGPVRGAVP